MSDDEPLLDIARGDKAQSDVLRVSLQALRDKSTNSEFRSLVDDVLSGNKSLRDVAGSQVFNDSLATQASQGIEAYKALTEEEKQELAAQGEQYLDQIRSGETTATEIFYGKQSLEDPYEDEYVFDPDDPLRRKK